MIKIPLLGFCPLLLALVALAGCAGREPPAEPLPANPSLPDSHRDDIDRPLHPHGGVIFDFGPWCAEFTLDQQTKQVSMYILTKDLRGTAVPIRCDKLVLDMKFPPPSFQLELSASPQEGDPPGMSSRFAGWHEKFAKGDKFSGTLTGLVDGKSYSTTFGIQADGW